MSRFRTGATALAALAGCQQRPRSRVRRRRRRQRRRGRSGTDGTDSDGTPAIDLPECPVDAPRGRGGPGRGRRLAHPAGQAPRDPRGRRRRVQRAPRTRSRCSSRARASSYEELQRKFEAAIASEDLPQVLVFDDTATQVMADSGVDPARPVVPRRGRPDHRRPARGRGRLLHARRCALARLGQPRQHPHVLQHRPLRGGRARPRGPAHHAGRAAGGGRGASRPPASPTPRSSTSSRPGRPSSG